MSVRSFPSLAQPEPMPLPTEMLLALDARLEATALKEQILHPSQQAALQDRIALQEQLTLFPSALLVLGVTCGISTPPSSATFALVDVIAHRPASLSPLASALPGTTA